MNESIENNRVSLVGKVVSDYKYSHSSFGKNIYKTVIEVQRLSGCFDYIPVMVSENMFDITRSYIGKKMHVIGQYRSRNQQEKEKKRLVLYVFARKIEILKEEKEERKDNFIYLNGFICMKPIYRRTPLGRRITDLLVAVNREYGNSDYIPCICWGNDAATASELDIGANVQIIGRIQSREYIKNLDAGEIEKRITYEVSARSIEKSMDML